MLQDLCETGQSLLMRMDYVGAIRALERAEQIAWEQQDWDTLSRLYMPLQEARRQRRIRCGEGTVRLDLIARSESDTPIPDDITDHYPDGQLLVAGWGTIAPAIRLREIIEKQGLFLETFLAAAYPIGGALAVVIAPHEGTNLPPITPRSAVDELLRQLPPHCIVLHENQLLPGPQKGTPQTYAHIMDLWERLHAPFLATADQTPDPLARMEAYRKTIRVDYACELAHQNLSHAARELDRQRARSALADLESQI